MESNGERDFIHCSQRTAELLIRAGKKHWITARDDKIVAKGKRSSIILACCGLQSFPVCP
jgi:hypothetical protein